MPEGEFPRFEVVEVIRFRPTEGNLLLLFDECGHWAVADDPLDGPECLCPVCRELRPIGARVSTGRLIARDITPPPAANQLMWPVRSEPVVRLAECVCAGITDDPTCPRHGSAARAAQAMCTCAEPSIRLEVTCPRHWRDATPPPAAETRPDAP